MPRRDRYIFLLLLGGFATLWCIHVWTMDEPPDLGAPIPVGGVFALMVVYGLTAVQWLTGKIKGTRDKNS